MTIFVYFCMCSFGPIFVHLFEQYCKRLQNNVVKFV
jgi:hypothetical protein